jgi:translation initiation factor IF-3
VIDPEGKMIGILPTREALGQAVAAGLDLVEVDPRATPPVCKIIDFGKYKYEKKKQEARSRASQTVVELKEIKLRPKTDDHDLETKGRHAREFLQDGHRVKFTVRFRGREITHPAVAQQQLDTLVGMLKDVGRVETRPMMEARTMCLILAPGVK